MIVLGIHSSYNSKIHDPSACIFIDGKLLFAIEEERLNRNKSSIGHFPERAIKKCLDFANININDVDFIASDGISHISLENKIQNSLKSTFGYSPKIKIYDHSLCHNFGSFIYSGFNESLSISFDGVGDGVSTKVVKFSKNEEGLIIYNELEKLNHEFSLGNFYTSFTNYLGFKSIEGEFKVMGMAAYGTPKFDLSFFLKYQNYSWTNSNYKNIFNVDNYTSIYESSCDEDKIFDYTKVKRMNFHNSNYDQSHFDLAASVQKTFEDNYLNYIDDMISKYKPSNLCISGGCALNCLANSKLFELPLKDFFIFPASSDRGLCIGSAAICLNEQGKTINVSNDMFLGTEYSNSEIYSILKILGINFIELEDMNSDLVNEISNSKIIGLNIGRSEFGPRALGHRSILASPSTIGMKDKINNKIKFREKFRPFAPMVLDTKLVNEKVNRNNNFMTIATKPSSFIHKHIRETIHEDGTSRIQSIKSNIEDPIRSILFEMNKQGLFPGLINTSFNTNGEPIVDSPIDSVRTFYGSGLDILYLNNFKIFK